MDKINIKTNGINKYFKQYYYCTDWMSHPNTRNLIYKLISFQINLIRFLFNFFVYLQLNFLLSYDLSVTCDILEKYDLFSLIFFDKYRLYS